MYIARSLYPYPQAIIVQSHEIFDLEIFSPKNFSMAPSETLKDDFDFFLTFTRMFE